MSLCHPANLTDAAFSAPPADGLTTEPVVPAGVRDLAIPRLHPSEPVPLSTDPCVPPASSPPQVLVVDDSVAERSLMRRLLTGEGYGVAEATNGAEAITVLKQERVDLVLLDLQMPVADGFDVLAYVREHRQSLPVVLLSGMPLDSIQHRMRSMQTPELPPLFTKPVDADQVLDVVDLLLHGVLTPADLTGAGREGSSVRAG